MRTVDQKKYTTEYFTEDCEGHEGWIKNGKAQLTPRLSEAFSLVKIKKGMVVVDFGSGRGELAYQAALAGANVIGLDYSEAAIKLSKKLVKPRHGELSFQLIKGHKLPVKDKSVDLIYFIDVIEHLYPEEVAAILSEFKRILKKGGKVVMHTAPNKNFYDYGYPLFTRYSNFLANLFVWPMVFHEKLNTAANPRSKYEMEVHVNECTQEMIAKYFELAGFSTKVWLSSDFRLIRFRDKLRYLLLQPQIGFLKRWFAYDVWAIATA